MMLKLKSKERIVLEEGRIGVGKSVHVLVRGRVVVSILFALWILPFHVTQDISLFLKSKTKC